MHFFFRLFTCSEIQEEYYFKVLNLLTVPDLVITLNLEITPTVYVQELGMTLKKGWILLYCIQNDLNWSCLRILPWVIILRYSLPWVIILRHSPSKYISIMFLSFEVWEICPKDRYPCNILPQYAYPELKHMTEIIDVLYLWVCLMKEKTHTHTAK